MALYAESSREAYRILRQTFVDGQSLLSASRMECLRFVFSNYEKEGYGGMISRRDIEDDYAGWLKDNPSPIKGASSHPNTMARRLTDCVKQGALAYIGTKYNRSKTDKGQKVLVQGAAPTKRIDLKVLESGEKETGKKQPQYYLLIRGNDGFAVEGPYKTRKSVMKEVGRLRDAEGLEDDNLVVVRRCRAWVSKSASKPPKKPTGRLKGFLY